MEEKRKRKDDGEANRKRRNTTEEDDGVKMVVPGDDEVDEFFAILKRIQVAVKYFKNRDGVKCIHRELTARPRRSPSLETEHLNGVKKVTEISDENRNGVLDLTSYPDSDERVNDSDSV